MSNQHTVEVEYHAVDHLPAEAVALLDIGPERVDVYLSQAYSLPQLAAHLNPLMAAYREAFGVQQTLSLVG